MQKKVYRVFVEKKPEFAHEAHFLGDDISFSVIITRLIYYFSQNRPPKNIPKTLLIEEETRYRLIKTARMVIPEEGDDN